VIQAAQGLRVQLPANPRILVARLDSLGDCILSSSFFIGLRRLFPTAHLTGAFSETTASLFEHGPLFDRLIPVPPQPSGGWPDMLDPPYDLAICPRWDVDPWSTRQLMLLSQAPVRLGFDRGPYRHDMPDDGWPGAYFTHLVRTRSDHHEVMKGQDLLHYLGAIGAAPDPQLWLTEAATSCADDYILAQRLDRFAVLAIAARVQRRAWPVENFLPVIDALASRARGLRLIVIGGEDAAAAGAWLRQQRPDSVLEVVGALPLLSSAALIARSELYIGMDTGPMHMAAALGVPVVEISCHPLSGSADHPNSPDRFGPYATRNRVLRPAKPLAPCTDGCEADREPHCIMQVAASDVIAAALDLLAPIRP
jgi:ADP-heptose:LPS heptosyltransferase